MKRAITFIKNQQTSIVTTREDLLKEINHFSAFWLSSVGATYSSASGNVRIVVEEFTKEDRLFLSARMRG